MRVSYIHLVRVSGSVRVSYIHMKTKYEHEGQTVMASDILLIHIVSLQCKCSEAKTQVSSLLMELCDPTHQSLQMKDMSLVTITINKVTPYNTHFIL